MGRLQGARRGSTVGHRQRGEARASRATGGDHRPVNALQELIQTWLDADEAHSVALLAHRGGLSRNTIYAIMKRSDPASLPRRDTLRRLAKGMELPARTVEEAAARSAGYRVDSELDPESQEIQAWLALLEDLSAERRTELWEIGRMYLRRAKDEP